MHKDVCAQANNNNFQFQMQHNSPIEMNADEIIKSWLIYIHQNPIHTGFVDLSKEGEYNSAQEYEGEKELLAIAFLK